MNNARFVLPLLFLSLLPAKAWCQDVEELSEPPVRFHGIYVTIMHKTISNVPLTHQTDRYDFPIWKKSIKSSSSCPAYAVGVSVVQKKLYTALEFEFSRPSFTDARISNRSVFCFSGLLYIGIVGSPESLLVPYVNFGIEGFFQSDYPDRADEDYILEYLEKSDGYGLIGVGIKFSPIKNLVVNAELNYAIKATSSIPSDDRDYYWSYEEKTKWESMGKRISLGLTYLWEPESIFGIPW